LEEEARPSTRFESDESATADRRVRRLVGLGSVVSSPPASAKSSASGSGAPDLCALPEAWRKGFEPARTVKTGALKVTLEREEGGQ